MRHFQYINKYIFILIATLCFMLFDFWLISFSADISPAFEIIALSLFHFKFHETL